jgi:hypothetical protein
MLRRTAWIRNTCRGAPGGGQNPCRRRLTFALVLLHLSRWERRGQKGLIVTPGRKLAAWQNVASFVATMVQVDEYAAGILLEITNRHMS